MQYRSSGFRIQGFWGLGIVADIFEDFSLPRKPIRELPKPFQTNPSPEAAAYSRTAKNPETPPSAEASGP